MEIGQLAIRLECKLAYLHFLTDDELSFSKMFLKNGIIILLVQFSC